MKKTFFKSVVATAVVTAAMALSSVAAFADGDTYTYNMDDLLTDDYVSNTLGVSVFNYDGSTKPGDTSTSSDTYTETGKTCAETYVIENSPTINSGADNEITIKSDLDPVAIDYANKSLMQTPTTEGSLSGTVLDRAVFSYQGNSKDLLTISNVPAGYAVEVYYTGTDSKGVPGKAYSIKITDSASESSTYTSGTSTATPSYACYKVTASGDVTIANGGSTRAAIFAIALSPAATAEEGTITYAANNSAAGTIVLSDGNDTYTSGSTFDGGTELTLTATANDDYVVDDIIADGASIMNSDGSTASINVDGNMDITVMFRKILTEAVTLSGTDFSSSSDKILLTGTSTPASDYYFKGGSSTSYTTNSSVNVMVVSGVASGSQYGLTFKTGDVSGLKMNVTYSHGSSGAARYLRVIAGNTNNDDTTGSTSKSDKVTVNYDLSANTEYKIGSTGSNIYLYSVEIYVPSENGLTTTDDGGIYVLDEDTYVIAGVSKDDLADNDYLYVTVGGKTVSTDTVYTAVTINDDVTVNASTINADYLYAIKIADANGYPNVDFTTSFTDTTNTEE